MIINYNYFVTFLISGVFISIDKKNKINGNFFCFNASI